MRTYVLSLISLLLLALAGPTFAVDGVAEINQTCAVNTGCFAGDFAGFPVTISSAGSYLLTGNLTVPNANTTAVSITTNEVVLDLRGFAIQGPGGFGTGDGVSQSGALNRATVRNGTIEGMGSDGVSLGREARVLDLTVFDSGATGISVSNAGLVRGNTVRSSGAAGVVTGGPSLIEGNLVYQSGDEGVVAAGAGSLVLGNVIHSSTGVGLRAIGTAGFANNTLVSNNAGGSQTSGPVVSLGANLCTFSTSCP